MSGLDGKVVLVTGAAGGIGRAIAATLTGAGARVLAVDAEPAESGPGEPFAADLATREGNRAAVEAALERFGRLDAIVPNAGFQHVSPVSSFDEDRWDALLAVMLTSPFLLARYGWEALSVSGDGRIAVVASVHGLVASPFKAGLRRGEARRLGLVKTLALEAPAWASAPRRSARATSGRRSSSARSPTRRTRTACPPTRCSKK
jgi:3-hydroxybutyrate dehydrogenase